jgi:hypothetical protein
MPNVGLLTASEPVPPDTGISIRYTVEVGGLPVYTELYDVRKLKREWEENPQRVQREWARRLEAPVRAEDQPRFSCHLTAGLHPSETPRPARQKPPAARRRK